MAKRFLFVCLGIPTLMVGLSGGATGGSNLLTKVAVHLKAHPTLCGKGFPVFVGCHAISTTWVVGEDADVLPVFFDLVEYSATEFGLDWPAAWGSMSWTRCRGDAAIGTIASPGDGVSITWATCQNTWSVAPGYGWLSPTGTGVVEMVQNPATGKLCATDCAIPIGRDDYPILNCYGGIGIAGENPCTVPIVPLTIEKDDGIEEPLCLYSGASVTYVVAYTNPNPGWVTGVVVCDYLPSELDFLSATHGGIYDAGLHRVTWTMGPLGAYQSGSVSTSLAVRTDAAPGSTIVNSAAVWFNEREVPSTVNHSTRVCGCIEGPTRVSASSMNSYCGLPGPHEYRWSVTGNGNLEGPDNTGTAQVLAGQDCDSTFTLTLVVDSADTCRLGVLVQCGPTTLETSTWGSIKAQFR